MTTERETDRPVASPLDAARRAYVEAMKHYNPDSEADQVEPWAVAVDAALAHRSAQDDPQQDEAVYLVAVRAKPQPVGNANPIDHNGIMEGIKAALDNYLPPRAVVARGASVSLCSALTANHNGYLREFGFDFDSANSIITVAWRTEQ